MDTQENTNMELNPVNEENNENVVDSGTTAPAEAESNPQESNLHETSMSEAPEKVPAKRGRKKKVVEQPEISENENQPVEEVQEPLSEAVKEQIPESFSDEKAIEPVSEAIERQVTESIQDEVVAPEAGIELPVEENIEPVAEAAKEKISESIQDEVVAPEASIELSVEEAIEPASEMIEGQLPESISDEVIEPEVKEEVQDAKTAQQEEEEKPVAKRGRKKKEVSEPETIQQDAAPAETEQPVELVNEEELAGCDMVRLIEITESVLEQDNLSKIKSAMILLRKRFEELEHEYEQQAIINDAESKTEEGQEETVETTDEFKTQAELFRKQLTKYSRLRKLHNEKLEAEKLRNYDLKKQILEDLKQLIESEETLQKSWEDFKRLQQAWKEIGHVPPAQSQDLWNSFNHFVDLFLDKVKINRELRDLDYKKNLETKLEICEKIEELFLDESIDNAFKKLNDLQAFWRETGPVPSDKREEINGRFNSAIEKLREKRREHYQVFKVEQENNLEVKRALIIKMREINEQEITTAKAWGATTEMVEELMKMWKNTGPVPKKYNEEVWKEFRQEMSRFFAEKKTYFGKMKDELMENYNRKQLLCKQAESLQESTDWKKSTQELITLQNEWKTIGPVPHRYSDNIWKQFRMACDVFFNRKKEYFSNLDKHEEESLKAKQELIEQMLAYEFGEDSRANLEAIKDFQRRFFEIGRVPLKEKNNIQSAFQKAVDGLLDKLKIGRDEKRRFDMKQKYESIGTSKSGQGDIRKESFAVSAKIGKLEADIQLWENNIEFFAKSKNAEILTREFREKIERAKAELLILKEKQKMMKDMIN
jgi:hypothetical protein